MNNYPLLKAIVVFKTFFLCLISFDLQSSPLRVDINSTNRSDMQSEGWSNWHPKDGILNTEFSGIKITIRGSSKDSPLLLRGNKAVVVNGTTLGADCITYSDHKDPSLELILEGLSKGKHSFVGFHHSLDKKAGSFTVAVGKIKSMPFFPSHVATHNDEVGSSYVEFEVKDEEPITIKIVPTDDGEVILSGFALDVSDPRRKALIPSPRNGQRHANGESGKVSLTWKASSNSIRNHVYLAKSYDLDQGIATISNSHKDTEFLIGTTTKSSMDVSVARDPLLYHIWRIDSEDVMGRITRGDVWYFRVRHLSFPTAEGYGRFAIGGRGGRVFHVTNLKDSGPGSLREAVEAKGPRTVVFDVSGLISLKSKLVFKKENEFLTIAGQTAPGKGICIRNYTFGGLGARDTIIRYMRLRLGDLAEKTMDGMGLAGSNHSIVDHCSISWTIDEGFSSRGAKNITFQRNIISEALNIANHKKYQKGKGHGFAASIGGDVGSFHHNLLAHNAGRNWSLAGGVNQANRHSGKVDIRNTVVYNWVHRTTDGGAQQVQFINNYYKPGPASKIFTYLNPQFENPAFGPQKYYVLGNVVEGHSDAEGPVGPFKGIKVRGTQLAPVTLSSRFFNPYVQTHSINDIFDEVLSNVGCNFPAQDDHDKRVINETMNGTAMYHGSISGLPGIPDSQKDVGGWEEYQEIHRPGDWDTDQDGMPNHWEIKIGLNPDNPQDGNQDRNSDGYTNLEEYLGWLVGEF